MFDKVCKTDPDMDLVYRLSVLLAKDESFDVTDFLSLPNATEKKIKQLHEAHKNARAKAQKEKK